MKIKAIKSWQNGQEKSGTEFNLIIINDNLLDSANFSYSIYSEEISHTETIKLPTIDNSELNEDVKIIDSKSELLSEGNLYINGKEYEDWGKNQDINYAAYVLAAQKLNLELLP
jgi:hypothetical protein